MKIIQQFITKDDSYRNNVNKVDSRYTTFQKRGPIGLMLHSVGCSQPSAKVFADGWNRSGREASVHAVLQADGTVYQTMPWNFRAWHCGGAANDTHVGVEMTEPGCITYISGSRFTCSDLAAAKAQVKGTYNTAADLFATLCDKYDLDPMTAIISHKEGNDKGVASNHGDPEHLWKGLDMGYTMDLTIISVPAIGEFSVIFTSGSTATTVSLPATLKMPSFTIEANMIYELNVMDGRGLLAGWSST